MLIKLHRFNTEIMRNFNFLVSFILFLNLSVYAQYNGLGFVFPLERDIAVTGNYGELRPNHFHAGIDFSTNQVINLPIKSVSDGYVSRIKISNGGYGRVIYITHPNGYVTVYGHQKRFAEKIESYLKAKQIEQKKNELELFPKQGELKIGKGEVIGYSGNTGSSTGPHLHFEIRDEKTEIPLNPLLFYNVKDDIKPTVTHIAIYNTADTNSILRQQILNLNEKAVKFANKKQTIILKQNTFAVAFSGYDKANGAANKNNIYEAKIKFDNQLVYHHQLNNISFDDARYVNYFSEKINGIKFQKCFSSACNNVTIYKTLLNHGRMVLKDTLLHTIELTVLDEKGNSDSVLFYVKAKQISGYTPSPFKYNALCDKDFILKNTNFELNVPANTLFNAAFLNQVTYIIQPANGEILIGNENIKVLKSFKMSIKIKSPLKDKESKIIMTVNGDVIGGKFENGWLRAEPKAFGNFNYKYDTLAPVISIVPIKKSKEGAIDHLSFKISDNLSGIADYNLYINDIWQIAEYDAKTKTVTSSIDIINKEGLAKVHFEVTDKVGNKTVLSKEL